MALYNETITFLNYVKQVQNIVDTNLNNLMMQTETSRAQYLRSAVIQQDFNFDAWISAKAGDLARDSIIAKLNIELVGEATKYFDLKVKELLNTYRLGGESSNNQNLKADDFLVHESLLPPIDVIQKANAMPNEDWLNYGAYSTK